MHPYKLLAGLLATFAIGCVNVYSIPAPPPENERRSVSLIPGEEERQTERDYMAARATIVKVNSLLTQQRYVEALEHLSAETRAFLSHGGNASPDEVLASRNLKLPDGSVVSFEPAALLLAEDISKLEDSVEGINEQETRSRKEIFAVLADGQVTRIVVIKEGGEWVIHRTRKPSKLRINAEK